MQSLPLLSLLPVRPSNSQMTMSSSTSSSHCAPSSFSRKLFLWLLPATVTLFTTIHQSPFAAASPFMPQKDDSVVVPMTSFGRPLPLSLVPTPPLYFVFPENVPLERPFDEQNDDGGSEEQFAEEAMGTKAKRAQTFVRFGKRAQTFVRFGKRAQTFVRLGRDTQRQFDGKMQSEQQQKKA
uniref:Transmembrane protein n=1 Tax=Globodera pallida TaxID=36090 RepID=A0A183CL86_GLOPA